MAEFTLYSRRGCHLCDDMADALRPLLEATGGTMRILDIDADPALREKYDWRIPVLTLEGDVVCEGRLDDDAVRDALTRR